LLKHNILTVKKYEEWHDKNYAIVYTTLRGGNNVFREELFFSRAKKINKWLIRVQMLTIRHFNTPQRIETLKLSPKCCLRCVFSAASSEGKVNKLLG
jgi:hypothetical protein